MRYKLSVIVPSRNGRELLEEHLAHNFSFLEKYCSLDFELIVVDDGSSDNSLNWLQKWSSGSDVCRGVRRFEASMNERGFGNACNFGASVAGGDVFLFINNDVRFNRGSLDKFLTPFSRDASLACIVPCIYRPSEDIIESITVGKLGRSALRISHNGARRVDPTQQYFVLWPCGAAFACRASAFHSVNGFASEYNPAYSEDVDLGIHLWRNGLKTLYFPVLHVTHWHNSTTKKFGSRWVDYHLLRNYYLLNIKHLNRRHLSSFLLTQFLRSLLSVKWRSLNALFAALYRGVSFRVRRHHYQFTLASTLSRIRSENQFIRPF